MADVCSWWMVVWKPFFGSFRSSIFYVCCCHICLVGFRPCQCGIQCGAQDDKWGGCQRCLWAAFYEGLSQLNYSLIVYGASCPLYSPSQQIVWSRAVQVTAGLLLGPQYRTPDLQCLPVIHIVTEACLGALCPSGRLRSCTLTCAYQEDCRHCSRKARACHPTAILPHRTEATSTQPLRGARPTNCTPV